MYLVNGITDEAYQEIEIDVPTLNENFKMVLKFFPTQNAWYMDFFYKEIETYNKKLVLCPNVLRQFKNLIQFGLMIDSEDGVYPMEITAFSSGRVNMYLLDADDIEEMEVQVYGGEL